LRTTEITHQLRRCFGDIRAALTEFFRVRDAVIALVRRAKPGEFLFMRHPIELTRVDDTSADCNAVSVHIFRRRVRYDIRAVFKGTAVDRGGKRVVDNQGNAVRVRRFGEFFYIQNGEGRVGNRFAKHRFRIRFERRVQFLLRAIGVNERELDAHFLHRNGKQVIGAAVNAGGRNYVVATACDIEHGEKGSGLSRREEHCRAAAFQSANFCRDRIAGGVLQTGIKIAACFQIKQFAHILAGIIFKSRALDDRHLTGFAVAGRIAALYAGCFNAWFLIFHKLSPFALAREIIYHFSITRKKDFRQVFCG